MSLLIGIDFDNTIVAYDQVFPRLAAATGLAMDSGPWDKTRLRDALRSQPEGEMQWRYLQAKAYGPGIHGARPAAGVKDFFLACRRAGIQCAIVSHKTRYAQNGPLTYDLREHARTWLIDNGFFADGVGLSPDQVFFESTRQEKIERIRMLGLTHFIDDLPEVFGDETFPGNVVGILYAPQGPPPLAPVRKVCSSWSAIADFLLCGEGAGSHGCAG